MTRPAVGASERARRKELVTLSVISASTVTLAASWLGISSADGAREAPRQSVESFEVAAGPGGAPPAAVPAPAPLEGSGLQPAPRQTRQVVVVRRSRAS